MRNKLLLILCVTAALALTGCGGSSSASGDVSSTVADAIEAQEANEDDGEVDIEEDVEDYLEEQEEETEAENEKAEEEAEDAMSSTQGVDVDLTALSSTMVYSEVYNMMVTPEDYMGKVVKMTGLYSRFKDETTGIVYHCCVIQDATACCSQGIEFVLTDEDDYPEEDGEEVTVVGTFDTYDEDDITYCTLRNATRVQ
ncbi:MAG: hypothetical protein K5840_03065 [Eubacterium sp.]|nr:hypothetical protein [Eubacterium sp.]